MTFSAGAYAILLTLLLAWPAAGVFTLLNTVFISTIRRTNPKFAMWNTAFVLACGLLAFFLFWSAISTNLQINSKMLAGLLEFLVFAVPAMVFCHFAVLICCWRKLKKHREALNETVATRVL